MWFECGDGDLAIGCAAKNAAIQPTGSSGTRWIAVKKPFENWRRDHDHLHPLQIRVSRLQHRRETGGFHFSPFLGAGLLKAPMQADLLQSLFAVQFLLEPTESLLHRLAFF
jgi:hypothetical protein